MKEKQLVTMLEQAKKDQRIQAMASSEEIARLEAKLAAENLEMEATLKRRAK